MANGFKKFKEVFRDVELDEKLSRITDFIEVERVCLNRDKDALNIYICSHQWIHKAHLYKLEKLIKRQLFKGYRISVYIHERFILSSQYTPETFFENYRRSMVYELGEKSHVLAHILNDAEVDFYDTEITLKIKSSALFGGMEAELTDFLYEVFRSRAGFDIELKIKHYENSGKSAADRSEDEALRARVEEIVSHAKVNEAAGEVAEAEASKDKEAEKPAKHSRKADKQDPDVLYGYDIKEDSVQICDLDESPGIVVIKGEVMDTDSRDLKSGKKLFIFSVTDYTDSIQVKMFLDPEKYDEVAPKIKKGKILKIKGKASMDSFTNEVNISFVSGIKETAPFKETRKDLSAQKRVELHCHSKMSDMDGVTDAAVLVKRAYEWGHPAIALTDHGVVQAFPDANHAMEDIDKKYRDNYAKEHPEVSKDELKKISSPFKVIYGCEIYIVDDTKKLIQNPKGQSLDDTYVVFDLETTGFSPDSSKIIEIGAVKVEGQKIVGRYSTFVNPETPIPLRIEQLTGINDSMVVGSRTIEDILPEFLEFCNGAVLVAHNAGFDCSFVKKNAADLGLDFEPTVVDTVSLSRYLLPRLSRFKLDTIAKHLGVHLGNHHRAVDDAEATANIFIKLCAMLAEQDITDLTALNEKAVLSADAIRHLHSNHAVVLVKNEIGRVNLYRIISESHLKYFYRHPLVPKSVFTKYREGLILGTACASGELHSAIVRGASGQEISSIVDYYDYLEIQPVGNSAFLIKDERTESVMSEDDLRDINKKILRLGEEFNKPVVATGDVHFLDPDDEVYRRIIMFGQGYSDADDQAPLYLHTTQEMLDEFSYLGEAEANNVVIKNPQLIADMCEKISPIRKGKFPPVIENSDKDLRRICYDEAHRIYGEELPKVVTDRLERELNSIISNGYAVMYIIAQKLVWKSNDDGYLVGSRGSVGSSFVATMAGITEVNPLSAHYLCPECHYVDFESEEVLSYAGRCGVDMPDKLCPKCGHPLKKMGFDIPFETFLGFKGNKEPDIDLNFSGEYQSNAHKYTEVIFGEGQTFRAGTIGTLAEKTAYGFVKKYFEEKGIAKRGCETDRIVKGCTGIRRTTGQHPGGIIVLPHGEDINSFTPVQHPANDMTSDIITTHFDYHSIDENLLKLDILGHDDPTMIKMLEDLTGTSAKDIPLDEPKVMSLFKSTEALGITPKDIGGCQLGCLGVPEFGTEFVIQMLLDTKPESFSDLIRISGLSHGTDVWIGNAKTLIAEGNATISTAICTRDDIMIYLIGKGLESELAFTIMESVRKGKGLKAEWEEEMKAHDVPDWYIWSCKKIKYMFPKAHAAAYVMMAYRIAWYKIYYPLAYYAAFFSIRASAFNYDIMCRGRERLLQHIEDYTARINELSKKEQDTLRDMKIVREMYARGFDFAPVDVYESNAHKFKIKDGKLLPALDSIDGLGDKAADAVAAEAARGRFISQEDFRNRTKISKTVINYLVQIGILKDLPESDQISLFEMLS
jgi:DNA polymerase-3 subunit alpha (Gram-positive type)